MVVCRVKGSVVSTNKTDKLQGMKLMVVCQFNVEAGKEEGCAYIAIDTVGAGQDEIVLVVSGSSSRQTLQTENKPVDAAIIAIIDSIEIHGKTVFKK